LFLKIGINLKRFLKYMIFTLLIIFISFGYYSRNKGKAINIFGNYISVVVSGSMEKTIKTNDFIIYKESDNYEVNDIIVFKVNDYLVVHRIIYEDENGYVTKGDNNLSDDLSRYGYIQEKQIVGKVTHNFHLFGIGKFLIPNSK